MDVRNALCIAALLVAALSGCGGPDQATPGRPSTAAAGRAAGDTSTPTPPPQYKTMIPSSTGRIDPIQVLDQKMTTAQIQSEAPLETAVWGAFSPSVWYGAHPNMRLSLYMLPVEDNNIATGHDLQWFETNHPDWILYACEKDGTPTHYVPRASGFPDVPLDFHNPAVIAYQAQTLTKYMIANHLNTIAADNVTFANYLEAPNSVLGQSVPGETPGADGWYGCGIWEGNTFVRRYTTGYDTADPAFIADMVNWVKTMHSILTTDTKIAPHHFRLIINHPLGSLSDSNETALVANVDGILDENGFSVYDHYNANVPFVVSWMEYAQQHGVAFFVNNYFCVLANGVQNCESSITPSQMDFAIATYELGNDGGAGMYNSPSTGEIYSYYSEYADHVGRPCGEYFDGPAPYIYERAFSRALVIANGSANAQSVPLPSNHTYRDLEGRTVANPLTVAGNDGYVLFTSNGCV